MSPAGAMPGARFRRCDLAIVGGGLAGGLIALACHQARPGARVLLIEGGETLGGNHVWSFFGSDVAPADRPLVDRFIDYRWPAYDVAFPDRARTLRTAYHAIPSERFDAVLRALLPAEAVLTGRRAIDVSPRAVVIADGTRIEADGVIDARGGGGGEHLRGGWQKFVGREIEVPGGHGIDRPIVMDATVPQIDGYRFVYCLPFSPTRLFVEDTYYSDDAALDVAAVDRRIGEYAHARGWEIAPGANDLRREAGVLPVLTGGDFEAYWASGGAGIPKAGVRAALFQPTTGYSLPDAVRTARLVAALPSFDADVLHVALHAHARSTWGGRGFYRLLDRMLFDAADPRDRYRVLERFYRLDAGLIARFYAGRSTMRDMARTLIGRPPVPIGRAIRAILSLPGGAGSGR